MRKQQRQILLLADAQSLLVVVMSLTLLIRRPTVTDLLVCITATIASLALNLLLKRSLDAQLFAPLKTFAADIAKLKPGRPVNNRPPMFEQLVIALERRMAELVAYQRRHRSDLRHENMRLESRIGELEEVLGGLQKNVTAGEARRDRDLEYASTIADAMAEPMTRFIADINQLTVENSSDLQMTRRIVSSADRLILLARETSDFDYSDAPDAQFDIRQLTDEVIVAISPGLAPRTRRILPFYDILGQKRFVGNVGMIRALLFNYLLVNLMHAESDDTMLHVSLLADGQLAFAVSPRTPARPDLQYRRLACLMSSLAATITEGMLRIPLTADENYQQPDASLRTLVICHTGRVRDSLVARLESMRVTVTESRYDVDVCIAEVDDQDEILDLRDKLAPGTRLLLVGNRSALPLSETRQLGWPLEHNTLAAEFLELVDARACATPLVLAVDDNPSNLKLLAIQLEDLGVAVETADSGTTALALASRHEFSMIISDMQLPDFTGFELARVVRARCREDIPIIILTARIGESSRRELLDAGITDVLVKPATKGVLSELLSSQKLITGERSTVHRPPMRASRSTLLELFEPELALKLANNRPDVAEEILEEVVACLADERAGINDAFESGSVQLFQARIHGLHGAVQYCGLPRLKNAVARLETIVGSASKQEVRLALSVFNSEVDAILAWYDPHTSYFDTSILRGS